MRVPLENCGSPWLEPMESSPAQVNQQTNSLLCNINYGNDCTSDMKTLLNEAAFYGRVAAASGAFEQCLDLAMRSGDPGRGGGPIDRARSLEATHGAAPKALLLLSPNEVSQYLPCCRALRWLIHQWT
jgi:hypothetical protein